MRTLKQTLRGRFIISVLACIFFFITIPLGRVASLNFNALSLEKFLLPKNGVPYREGFTLGSTGTSDCHGQYLRGVFYNAQGQTLLRDETWKVVLNCSPEYIQMIRSILPLDLELAAYSTQVYPKNPQAWFWRADAQAEKAYEQATKDYLTGLRLDASDITIWRKLSDLMVKLDPKTAIQYLGAFYPDLQTTLQQPGNIELRFLWARLTSQVSPSEGIRLYEEDLRLYPDDGYHWREFGDVLVKNNQPGSAIEAYLQSCYQGDPGSNGCYRAGLTAEGMGDITDAIRYYRLSKWSVSLERADQLEKQLTP